MVSREKVHAITARQVMGVTMCVLLCAQLLVSATVHADARGPHRLRLDVHGALSLRANDDRDGFGFGGGLEYEYVIAHRLGLGLRYEAAVFPYDNEMWRGSGFAVYHGIGPELRLHLARSTARIDPWIAGGPRLALTGSLKRFGVQAAIGVDFRIGQALSLGPTIAYMQIIQPDDSQSGAADGRILTFGLSLTWAPSRSSRDDATHSDEPTEEPEPSATEPQRDVVTDTTASETRETTPSTTREPEPRAPVEDVDSDGDGILDSEDACPNDPAPGGCPPPRPIELTISDFEFDSAFLNETQISQLRLVLDRLRNDRRIRRVRVIGHADQTGTEAHNRRLSERRAAAVVEWLVGHGIARRRLEIVGRGSSEPVIRGGTQEQLGTNRRVEFDIVDPSGSGR